MVTEDAVRNSTATLRFCGYFNYLVEDLNTWKPSL